MNSLPLLLSSDAASVLLAAPLFAQRPDAAKKQASHQRMVKELAEIAERAKSEHKYHGDQKAKALWAELAGGKAFADVTMASGTGHLQKGHGTCFEDLDDDGDRDLYTIQGGAYPGDAAHNVLFENPGFGNHWLAVQMVGTHSNRAAVGARIAAEIDDGGTVRTVYRYVGSGGCFGANPLRQHLGLGKASVAKALTITWPRDRKQVVLKDVPIDRTIRIVEGQDGLVEVARKPVVLGGKQDRSHDGSASSAAARSAAGRQLSAA